MITQDYTNPLFLEQEKWKIAEEVAKAFSEYLSLLPATSKYNRFMAAQGLYLGPYTDDPSASLPHEPFCNPRWNVTIDGSRSAFVPGMAKHAFNHGAADLNFDPEKRASLLFVFRMNDPVPDAELERWAKLTAFRDGGKVSPAFLEAYKQGAKSLEKMAWGVSRAMNNHDLDAALMHIYGREWIDFKPDQKPGLRKDV